MVKRYFITIIIALMVSVVVFPHFMIYNKYLYSDASKLQKILESRAQLGQDIVFQPGYLKYLLRPREMFFNYNIRPSADSSYYQNYFKIGICNNTKICISEAEYEEKIKASILDVYGNIEVRLGTEPCKDYGDYFKCGPFEWQESRLKYDFVNGKKILCMFTHPSENTELNILFKNLRDGYLFFGFFDSAANDPHLNNKIIFKTRKGEYTLTRLNRLEKYRVSREPELIIVKSENIEKNHVCIGFESIN